MKTISIIVNKNWETEPILNAMTNGDLRPNNLPFPDVLNSPKDKDNKMKSPRAVFKFPKRKKGEIVEDTLQVNIWCIQDLMSPDKSSSSSEEKFAVLPDILKAENTDLVIAVGTAGYPNENISLNGSIVIGANFFIHNGHSGNTASNLNRPEIGKLLDANINNDLFDLPKSPFTKSFKSQVESKLLSPPRNPAAQPVCIASKVFTAISSVNVTDYSEYNWVDHEAILHYDKVEQRLPKSSLETTHGVIKISSDKPIIFVSAITDRLGSFDVEVTSSQNYIASFNAGVVLGELICCLNDLVTKGFDFKKQIN